MLNADPCWPGGVVPCNAPRGLQGNHRDASKAEQSASSDAAPASEEGRLLGQGGH